MKRRESLAIEIVDLLIKSQDLADDKEYEDCRTEMLIKLNDYQEYIESPMNQNDLPFDPHQTHGSVVKQQETPQTTKHVPINNNNRNNLIFSDSEEPSDMENEDPFDEVVKFQDDEHLDGIENVNPYFQEESFMPVLIDESPTPNNKFTSNFIDMTNDPDVPDVVEIVNEREDINYPWTKNCYDLLRTVFKLSSFRPNQLQAINHTLLGHDTFTLMPTGGGKSLCFQLPSLITRGTTKGLSIVVTPLLSLMMDQVNALLAKGVNVGAFWGDMSAGQRNALKQQLQQSPCRLKLLYITPEMLNKSTFMQSLLPRLHQSKQLARFIIDEAHCLSSWGHDFRPDYKALSFMKRDFPDIPIMALTATANSKVRRDVISILGLRNAKMIKQSFNRPNLIYSVFERTANFFDEVVSFIKMKHPNESGIIYCQTRAKCESVASKLESQLSIKCYHAGLAKQDRTDVQQEWSRGDVKIIVATIAFGMGIDKANVRFVIHQALPSSVEGYYQETGRAGRDGLQSDCLLYFNYGDTKTVELLIKRGEGSHQQKQRQYDNLRQMVAYCDNKMECRRKVILHYFGEQFDQQECKGTCDNCKTTNNYVKQDVSAIAKDCLNIVDAVTMHGKFTLIYCTDVLRGSKIKKITEQRHDEIKGYGSGKHLCRSDVMRLFNELVTKGYLKEIVEMTKAGFASKYIYTTAVGMRALVGAPFKMELYTAPMKEKAEKPEKREKRKSTNSAKPSKKVKKGKPINWKTILQDKMTNKEIAEVIRRKPANLKEIKQLDCMNAERLASGLHSEMLKVINEHNK